MLEHEMSGEQLYLTPHDCIRTLAEDFAFLCASLAYPAWNGGLDELLYDLGSLTARLAFVAQLHDEAPWRSVNEAHFTESCKVLAYRLTLPETN